ncbi:MAG: hypothetical protein JW768_13670 [Chitinispirillaceae bacterium]|nr:hypothetical protein [Chitinispirillaceae bacterium]
MKVSRIVMLVSLFFFAVTTISLGRSILERKMFYINAQSGKSGQAKFWVIYLGNHEVTLNRKYPGEEIQPVTGSMNFQLLSSGYIEGNGYSVKGKLSCHPTMRLKNEQGTKKIAIDSIDCIYEHGRKVRLSSGEIGDFIIDVEGLPVVANRFIMREYKLTNYYGEEILKEGSEETRISAISFSKEGLARIPK